MLNLHDVMGNVASSLASGFFSAIGKVFGSPLDFLFGKSCRLVPFLYVSLAFLIMWLLPVNLIMYLILSYFVPF